MSNYHSAEITHVDRVSLLVSDLSRSVEFYTQILGLMLQQKSDDEVALGTSKRHLLTLKQHPHKESFDNSQVGLYHFALLLPNYSSLAHLFKHMVDHKTRFQGASDHLISNALYLADPDGYGIELARDTDPQTWPWHHGKLNIFGYNKALDVQKLYDNASIEPFTHIADDTIIGHIHLHASDLIQSKTFYTQLLKMDITIDLPNNALFVSNAHYHHHIALNRWHAHPQKSDEPIDYVSFHMNMPKNQVQQLILSFDQDKFPYKLLSDCLQFRDPNHLPYLIDR
jgi:catechol 2,3-dioxygenase